MFQSNQAYVQFVIITGGEQSVFAGRGWLFGLLIAGAVALVMCVVAAIYPARRAARLAPALVLNQDR